MGKKALIVVDMQNDFADPKGALYVKGGEKLIKKIENLIKNGPYDLIVVTRDWHPENHCSFKENGGQWPKHCVQYSWGAEFAIKIDTNKIVVDIVKGDNPNRDDYSGFNGHAYRFSAKLKYILREYGITSVDVVGLALDYCVKATAIDAVKSGFKTRVLLKYTKAVNLKPGDEQRAIEEIKKNGVKIK